MAHNKYISINQLVSISILLFSITFISGCVSTKENHGYIQKAELVNQIKAGTSGKEDVLRILGSPSTTSNFGNEKWYYISKKTEGIAFFDPKILEHKVFSVEFSNDIVTKISELSEKDMRKVNFAEEATPTEGTRLGVFEQLLGNLGRFNSERSQDVVRRAREGY